MADASNEIQLGRMKKRREFLAAARRGRKAVTPGLVLQALRREEAAEAPAQVRLGLTASRKVGNAVARNRARRRLRAAAQEVLTGLGRSGMDYVLIARGETGTRPYPELLQDLRAALSKVEEKRKSR
ncbi:MAG: ribonuclease P protein component [Rhodovibrionaceae bacterium]